MTKFYIINFGYISSNTEKHGFGDYPEKRYYVDLIVESETKRKAQNKAKKINPNLFFSGINGAMCLTSEQMEDFGVITDKAGYQVEYK